MRTIFDVCKPRPEILKGQYRQSDFAARLKDVVDNKAGSNPVYLDPKLFFANTYPTEGLKQLAQTVFGRMSGKDGGAPAIRLETSFGGGKTHDLIALYHLAKSGKTLPEATKILPKELLPQQAVCVAGIVAGDMDAVNGMIHADGTQALTLWGEMIYQLQGKAGFEANKEYDERKVPPGDAKLVEIFGSAPTLIMIDEIAKYIRALDDKEYVAKIPAFFMSLISVASSLPNVCFVFTLAEGVDAFGPENDMIRKELGSVSARECINLTPAKGKEIAQIMAHRLFEHIDTSAIEDVAQGYHDYYVKERGHKVEFGSHTDNAKEKIIENYPFHPELLRVLDLKVGSLDNFQKTRGALMLLSKVVSYLWNHQQTDMENTHLIHLHHIPFVAEVLELLTSRLDKPEMKAPVLADIFDAGHNAHAQQLDQINIALNKPPIHSWVATTIFLHSLVKSHNKGASLVEINFAVANPSVDAGTLAQAVEKLANVCWHLEPQGEDRFYFQPEPSLNKLIAEEMSKITESKVRTDLELDVTDLYSRGAHFKVYTGTLSPSDVDDAADKPKLIIIPPDEFQANSESDRLPAAAMNLFYKTGSLDQPRTHKNLMYFVFADRKNYTRVSELKRETMALEAIRQSELVFENLTERQKQILESRLDIAPLNLRINMANAFCYLAYPKGHQDLEAIRLALFESLLPKASVITSTEEKQRNKEIEKENRERQKNFDASDRQNTIIRMLDSMDKAITAQSRDIAPKRLKTWIFTTSKKKFTMAELLTFFASEANLPLILEKAKLRDSILAGIKEGVFHARKGKQIYYPEEPLDRSDFDWGQALEVALPETFRPPADLVTAPEGLFASDVAQDSFHLSWDPVEHANSYTIYLNGSAVASGIAKTNYSFANLKPGVLCEVSVEAMGRRNHARSEILTVTTATENVPSGLSCPTINETSARIQWKPLKGATGYAIYVNDQLMAKEHLETSYTLTGLKPAFGYEIVVKAIHNGDESDPSAPLRIRTKEGLATHFPLHTANVSPASAFEKLESHFAKEITETGGIEEIEFCFESFTDVDLVCGFLQVFMFPGNPTFAGLELNLEEGEDTSFEMNTQRFPLEKLTKLNLKGMLPMLKEMGHPEIELRLLTHFSSPARLDALQRIKQALLSKKVSEVKLNVRFMR